MHITNLSGSLGAEITSIDLNALSKDWFISLRDAFFSHGVVVIRNQSLTPDAHIALAKRFGTIDINRFYSFRESSQYSLSAHIARYDAGYRRGLAYGSFL